MSMCAKGAVRPNARSVRSGQVGAGDASPRKPASPFRYFNSSPEVIRLVMIMYVRFLLSLRNVEDLLFERGVDICHETLRMWWNRYCDYFNCSRADQHGRFKANSSERAAARW